MLFDQNVSLISKISIYPNPTNGSSSIILEKYARGEKEIDKILNELGITNKKGVTTKISGTGTEYDGTYLKFTDDVKKAIEEGRLNPDVEYIFFTTLPESGEGSFNTSNILGMDASTSESLTQAEMIGRNQVYQVVQILQNEIPGFENSYLLETAVQVGVRETRRAVGDYIVTGNDIKNGSKFDDAIARGCYGIDIHGQKDESSRMEDLEEGQYYEIPLRSLIVKDADNLLVAGRCISSTREGHSALRIMPTSAATGEACGALAALASKNSSIVREINPQEVREIVKHNITV